MLTNPVNQNTDEPYVMPKLEVGQKAPLFKLKNQAGEDVDIAKILQEGSKVLLIFYPGDDTPGCTAQLCGVRDIYKQYADLGVKVFGINHADEKSHNKFIQKYTFPFDILVDTNKEVAKKYGALKKFFLNLVIKRGVFLLDTDATIIYSYWGQQDNQKILDLLAKKA